MVDNNFVVLDEICHWLKLMYLFLRHFVYRDMYCLTRQQVITDQDMSCLLLYFLFGVFHSTLFERPTFE
jgi:hypothetical protein